MRMSSPVAWIITLVSAVLIVGSIVTSQAFDSTDSPLDEQLVLDSTVLGELMPDASEVAALTGRDMVQLHRGLPVSNFFEGTAPGVVDMRRNVVEAAWEDRWHAHDGRASLLIIAVVFRYRDYSARNLVHCEPSEPWPEIEHATTAGLVHALDFEARSCARVDNGRVTFWVFAHPSGENAEAQSRVILERTIADLLPRIPDSPDDLVPMSMNTVRTQLLLTWVAAFVVAMLAILPGVLRDRVTWQSLKAVFSGYPANPLHLDVSDDARRIRRTNRALLFARLAVLGWSVRLTEELMMGTYATLAVVLAAFVVGLGLQRWLMRRGRSKPIPRLIPARGIVVLAISVLAAFGVAAVGLAIWQSGASLASMGSVGQSSPEWLVQRSGLFMQGLGLIVVTLAAPALMIGRRIMMRTTRNQPLSGRPHTLYLRNFSDDYITMRAKGTGRGSIWDQVFLRRREQFEEVIAQLLSRYGTAVAVGRPKELLPPGHGAQRLYFGEDWQERVDQLMRESELICLSLGRTHGLVWEIQQLASRGVLHKTVFIMPPVDRDEQAERLALLAHYYDIGFDALVSPHHHVLALCWPLGHATPKVVVSDVQDEIGYGLALDQCAAMLDEPTNAPPDPSPLPVGVPPQFEVIPPQVDKKPKSGYGSLKIYAVSFGLTLATGVLGWVVSMEDVQSIDLPAGVYATASLGGTEREALFIVNGAFVVQADFPRGAVDVVAELPRFANHPKLEGDVVYFLGLQDSSTPASVAAFSLADDSLLWERDIPGDAASLGVLDGLVMVPDSTSDQVLFFDATTGDPMAPLELPCRPLMVSEVSGRGYVTCPDTTSVVEVSGGPAPTVATVHEVEWGTWQVVDFDGEPLAVNSVFRVIHPLDSSDEDGLVVRLTRPTPFIDSNLGLLAIQGVYRFSVISGQSITRHPTMAEAADLTILDDGGVVYLSGDTLWLKEAESR